MIYNMVENSTILLTRPERESLKIKDKLNKLGINSEISPTLKILAKIPQNTPQPLERYDIILITSKYTADHIQPHLTSTIPIYTIGQETTKALEEKGIKVTLTAGGNSQSLYKLIKENYPKSKNLIHFGGEDISANFKKHILESAFHVDHVSLYKAHPCTTLTDTAIILLKSHNISHVLHFSPRSAEIFETLCDQHGLTDRLSTITALCLAPTVVKSLDNNKWKKVDVARHANTSSMIEKLMDMTKSQEQK